MLYLMEKMFDLPMYWTWKYSHDNLMKETDFSIEADNGERAGSEIASYFKRDVPKVFRNVSSKRVLTCEWIDGVKLSDVKGIEALGGTTAQVMDTLVKVAGFQIFQTGFVHCDPHPGMCACVRRCMLRLVAY
jgi:aarF domain-containing kinase